ncbi:hypothetical protein P6166_04455 [Stenotrophomonas sp. HITSZ_GD]|nr:hypothetical protein [Stenotrophomonas sp. HITSZ_GD]MDG2524608.1 hypothetical protein [Stenotrophomonas sp. HITSZ_GD]
MTSIFDFPDALNPSIARACEAVQTHNLVRLNVLPALQAERDMVQKAVHG